MYIIHGEFNGQSFPSICCFIPFKTEETYINVFETIKSSLAARSVEINPQTIQIDFECVAFNAIKMCIPEAQITGCFFQFGQTIWGRVQSLGIVGLYNTNINFSIYAETITAIASVPLTEINEACLHYCERSL